MEGRVQKTIHYKLARYLKDGKRSLEADLLTAFRGKRTTVDRQQLIEQGGERRYRLINSVAESDALTSSVLIAFTEGVSQQVVALQDDAEELDLHAIAPRLPDEDSRAEFLDGLAYLGVKRNHVIILASQQLSAPTLEAHLNWFLKDHCEVVPKDESILLQDPVPTNVKQLRRVGVKQIRFDVPLELVEQEVDTESQEVVNRTAVSTSAKGWQVIREAFKVFGLEPPEVDPMSGIPAEELSVSLLITAKRGRTRSSDGHLLGTAVLDNLAIALRPYDDEDVPMTIEFKNGEKLKASELKVRTSVTVEHVDGILKGESVFTEMRSWFGDIIERKVVDP